MTAVHLARRPPTVVAPLWDAMDRRPRHAANITVLATVPKKPGVYAWYRDGYAVYVGKGDDLHDRIWKRHMGQSRSMHTSAFRRNVAEHLGFGSARDIYNKVIRLDTDQLAAVRGFIVTCFVAWIECDSTRKAIKLEDDMKDEWVPPLTKR